MGEQGGYGLVLKIDVAAAQTVVVGLEDLEMPKFKKFIAENTGHDSTGGYYTALATGKRRMEPFKATITWDVAQATHAAVVTAFNSDASVDMTVEDPAGAESIFFKAIIEEIQRMGGQENGYKAEVLIHPTGQPTIT